jgi:GTP-binding protein EngB required for normal cell division
MSQKIKVIFLGDSAVGKSSIIAALNNYPISTLHEV